MSVDQELVNRIVRQVLAELNGGARGQDAPTSRGAGVSPAETGPGKAEPAPGPESRTPGVRVALTSSSERRVFITAEMLERRLATNGHGPVELAANERLTPAARDVIDERHLSVKRAAAPSRNGSDSSARAPAPASAVGAASGASAAGGRASAAESGGARLGIVTDRAGRATESVLLSIRYDGIEAASYDLSDCPWRDLAALCEDLSAGRLDAGVVLFKYAADAMVLSAKHRGVRPVQGTRVDSVSAALRHFGANLLALEHGLSTFHQMRSMIRTFAAGPAGVPSAEFTAAIEKLERA